MHSYYRNEYLFSEIYLEEITQASERAEMLVSLNMPFPEISDWKVICKDVSGLGRWGNGDVEVGLTFIDELPYIMGLVRQSFERQMGNNNNGE